MFLWNFLDLKRVRWEGPDALKPGKHTLEYDFAYDGLGFATLTAKIDKLTITVAPPKLTPEDLKRLEAANRAAQDAI